MLLHFRVESVGRRRARQQLLVEKQVLGGALTLGIVLG
jgi:hypothetical protein